MKQRYAKTIAFEGIDGAGKTTQSLKLVDSLRGSGRGDVQLYKYTSKENFWGRTIKKIYSVETGGPYAVLQQCRSLQELLYALSARKNLEAIHGNSQSVIIADRSIVTAYASHHNLLPEWYLRLVEPKLIPDIVVYLDVEPATGLERIAERHIRFLDEDLSSEIEFRNTYLSFFNGDRPRALQSCKFLKIDGNLPEEDVHHEVLSQLERFLSEK